MDLDSNLCRFRLFRNGIWFFIRTNNFQWPIVVVSRLPLNILLFVFINTSNCCYFDLKKDSF